MDPLKFQFLKTGMEFVVIIVGMSCATGIITTFIKRGARKNLSSPEIMQRLDEINDRLSRLDNAMDSVAVEVERISEGQRFTTKLLAERGAPAVPDKARGGPAH